MPGAQERNRDGKGEKNRTRDASTLRASSPYRGPVRNKHGTAPVWKARSVEKPQ